MLLEAGARHLDFKIDSFGGQEISCISPFTLLYHNNPNAHSAPNEILTCLKLLIQYGFDLNKEHQRVLATNKVHVPILHEACLYGHSEVISFLLQAGIDSNSKQSNGQTALFSLVQNTGDCTLKSILLLINHLPFTTQIIDNTYHDTFFDAIMGQIQYIYTFKSANFELKCILKPTGATIRIECTEDSKLNEWIDLSKKIIKN